MLIFDEEVKGITDDSRQVKKDDLFIAIKGMNVDGHKYIAEAVKNGAKVIVGEEEIKVEGAKYVKVDDSRKTLGMVAAKWYDEPSKKLKVIGVTGTDGKTTTANLIYWILKTAGKKVGLISTINAKIGDEEYDTGFHVTNPEPILLQKLLAEMVEKNCEYAVLEVTSHGLDQERVAGVKFEMAVLTNITHEHLDYHKTFEKYVAAKGKLFENVKYSVLNSKNKSSSFILPYLSKKTRVFLYSFELLDKKLKDVVSKRFPESYNQENATAAVATTRILGVNKKEMVTAIKTFPQLSGRMEEIKNSKGIEIYVDFAHTPNALENVLTTLRERKKGRLIAIFGCASERDNKKRPMMAEISTRLADISIFTAEDPRSEDIKGIIKQMQAGVKNKEAKVYEIPERGEAIFFAINKVAKKGDIVVICGKGHEKSMAYYGIEYPWSDQEAVNLALRGEIKEIPWKKISRAWHSVINGKKIAVVGLGIEGKDVIKYLLGNGNQITLFDQKLEEELDFSGIDKNKIEIVCGPDYLMDGFKGFDYIFRSPAIRPDIPEFLEAKKSGTKVTSAMGVFFDMCQARIIGVTGTKGKGTTSTLIYDILNEDGKDVYLAGNIGRPYLELLPKLTKTNWIVLELSSFHLFDLTRSPHIAVVLNITLDHLDWHKNREEYVSAKANIVKYQNKNDFAVINFDYETPRSFGKMTKGQVFYFSKSKKVRGSFVEKGKVIVEVDDREIIGETKDLQLRGEHNWENVTAAITAAKLAGAKLSAIKKTVFGFKGLEHRLEFVGKYKGVSFYDDSFSTNPQTTIAAIKSFWEPLTLILGGSDKGLSYDDMAKEIVGRKNVKNIVLIGQIADVMEKSLERVRFQGKIVNLHMTTMKRIVKVAVENTENGGVVVLSPGSASFGMFKDYKDRGNQFKEVVEGL